MIDSLDDPRPDDFEEQLNDSGYKALKDWMGADDEYATFPLFTTWLKEKDLEFYSKLEADGVDLTTRIGQQLSLKDRENLDNYLTQYQAEKSSLGY